VGDEGVKLLDGGYYAIYSRAVVDNTQVGFSVMRDDGGTCTEVVARVDGLLQCHCGAFVQCMWCCLFWGFCVVHRCSAQCSAQMLSTAWGPYAAGSCV